MPILDHSPSRYRELSEPVPRGVIDDRLQAFFKELQELRIKHKIADVHVIVRADVIVQDDLIAEAEVAPVMTSGHLGDSRLAEPMTAWAFGRASAERMQEIDNVKANGIRAGRRDRER
jgi:hypothetical protein